jgi:A/G-specific adenine glycosylase
MLTEARESGNRQSPEDKAAVRLRRDLLAWYDRGRRVLPWRAVPGEAIDPYRVWLSEIMLQQTTVAAVIPFFQAFTARWPTVEALAAASLDEILHAWQGLGYYSRARNLLACARAVVDRHGSAFPSDEDVLRALPGIGAYTAAAIAAIAFDRPIVPVDGNVIRVAARLFGLRSPMPASRNQVVGAVAQFAERDRPGDLAQALMDLGATLCTPRRPRCGACPWQAACVANREGEPEAYPHRSAKPARPRRWGVAFWIERADGMILLRKRPPRGLLGGMMEVPSTPWLPEPWTIEEARALAPLPAGWSLRAGLAKHTFTHFELELRLLAAQVEQSATVSGLWCPRDRLGDQALPTVMKKVIRLAMNPERALTVDGNP